MSQKFEELEKISEIIVPSSRFDLRLGVTLKKYVDALTRLQLLKESNREAVDCAVKSVSQKLEFLKMLYKSPAISEKQDRGPQRLVQWLAATNGADTFSRETVFETYKAEGFPCGKVGWRTFQNWTREVCEQESHGKWKIKNSQRE